MSRFFAVGNDSDSDSSSEDESPIFKRPLSVYTEQEEDTRRVVRSVQEKRYEQYHRVITQAKNYRKIKDMNSLLNAFEELTLYYARTVSTLGKKSATPTFFLKWLLEMDDFVEGLWKDKDERKSMSKNNAKSMVALRQKLKKFIKEWDEELQLLREKEDYIAEDEAAEEEVEQVIVVDQSDDSVKWDDSEDSEDDDNQVMTYTSVRDRFLKQNKTDGVVVKKDVERREKKEKKQRSRDDEWRTIQKDGRAVFEKTVFPPDIEVTEEIVKNKLLDLSVIRGKKRSDRREIIEMLQDLQALIDASEFHISLSINCKVAVIMAMFDYNLNFIEAMKWEHWMKLVVRTHELVDLLTDYFNSSDQIIEMNWNFIVSIAERLNEEFYKLLKESDPHGGDYVERLKFESNLSEIINKFVLFVRNKGGPEECCRIYICKIEQSYYKRQNSIPDEEIDALCRYIYVNDSSGRLRTRAILCHIYFYAVHGHWEKARDLMLMSHLQEVVQYVDPSTQILYNRAIAQLGLAAFRNGLFNEAHQCLSELFSTGRAKELLGQGLLPHWRVERTQEQTKKELQRQIPFHMQLNLDVLEFVYLVSAMLVDVPNLAACENAPYRFTISKGFYILLRTTEKLAVQGPPETAREFVVAAARALRNGLYPQCVDCLFNPRMEAKIWRLLDDAPKIHKYLSTRLRKECLRSYIFAYSTAYNFISCNFLASMFDIKLSEVRSILGQMIVCDDLHATIDDVTGILLIHEILPTPLQLIALHLTDKLSILADVNERTGEKGSIRIGGTRMKI